MKNISLTGIKKLEAMDFPKPEIKNENEVLLKIDSVGICGSDMHYYNEGKIGDQIIEFPFTIGHECSAIVEDIGKSVSRVKRGDLVAIEPALSCHQCSQCKSGREHTCLNQKFLGCPGQINGGLSEYLVLPESNCYPVPKNFNGELAALVEPLSIGYYAANFIEGKSETSSIAILGVGPIGLSVLLSLKTMGKNNIYVTDKLDYRLKTAMNMGAVLTGNVDKEDIFSKFSEKNPVLFDIVYECCGKQEAIDQAVDLLKPGGELLIVGIPAGDRISFDINKVRRKEIVIQNVRRQNKSIQPVIDLINEKKMNPEIMITHLFKSEKTSEAFEIVDNYKDNVIKAVIKF